MNWTPSTQCFLESQPYHIHLETRDGVDTYHLWRGRQHLSTHLTPEGAQKAAISHKITFERLSYSGIYSEWQETPSGFVERLD